MTGTAKWTIGLTVTAAAALVLAGTLDLTWFTIDGGGNVSTSTGGDIEISGTIGQPDAAVLTGGSGANAIEIVGGFWGAPPDENDCNGNNIIDSVEIEQGLTPDCNGNGIPDSCDISNGTSLDVSPADGVPDECRNVIWTGTANTNWMSAGNWSPNGDPNNTSSAFYFVTIAPTGATGATVDMAHAPPGAQSDRTVQRLTLGAAPGTEILNIRANLFVNQRTTVNASGRIVLGPNETAALNGGTVTVNSGGEVRTGSASQGASINASLDNAGTVRATVNRDLDITGARFANLSTGTLQVDSGARVTVSSQTLTQAGTVTGSGGAIVAFTDAVLVNLANAHINLVGTTLAAEFGLLNEASGVISGVGGQIDGDIINDGSITFQGDLTLNGDVTNLDNGIITATGDFVITGGVTPPAFNISGGQLGLHPGNQSALLEGQTVGVSSGGEVQADGMTLISVQDDVVIDCTGEMHLGGTTDLLVGGDLVLDGLTAPECTQEGGGTPPVLEVTGGSATIQGVFRIEGCATVQQTSGAATLLAGNFVDHSVCPQNFQFNGGMEMNGTTPQTFEVAGRDRGPTLAGFVGNFAMGSVEVAGGANVSFVDAFDNVPTANGPCSEALYVQHLTLNAGAAITLSNCRVYFSQLSNAGATITRIGCGALVPTGDGNGDGVINLTDYCNFRACLENQPPCTPGVSCSAFDYDADNDRDLADFAVFQRAFTGPGG